MGALVAAIAGLFESGAGKSIGNTVANIAGLAALSPVAMWFLDHNTENAVTLTWGQLALFGGFSFVIIKVVHYTRAGAP